MTELRVNSWSELQERLYENSYQPALGRTRSPYVFRGLPLVNYPLTTTLMRLGGNYAKMEHHLLRNFRKYAKREVVEQDSIWNWLAVAQHHGLPTRLLDWTFSPHVAMHFATARLDQIDKDGIIWTVDFVRAHRLLPDALREVMEDEGSEIFTAEMLTRVAGTIGDLEQLSDDPFLLFFEPPSLDDRIVNQFALFSLISRSTEGFDRWVTEHTDLCRKIIIPAELKWEVRDRLDQANITERVLFPGLDGLSRWLRRYYSPRSVAPAPLDPYDDLPNRPDDVVDGPTDFP
ncbi:FRG domain-containing protein [soil metagenome]